MLNFLDASHFKLTLALNLSNGETDGTAAYKFSTYMEKTVDKAVSIIYPYFTRH